MEREEELEEAWKGNPRRLLDAIQFDLFELIPVMGQVSRFQAGLKAREEEVRGGFASTWIFPIIPVRTIRYLLVRKRQD